MAQTGGRADGKGVRGKPEKFYRADDSFLPIKGGSPGGMNQEEDDELFG